MVARGSRQLTLLTVLTTPLYDQYLHLESSLKARHCRHKLVRAMFLAKRYKTCFMKPPLTVLVRKAP